MDKRNKWHASDLDEFVKKCDDLGGVQHPDAASFIANFELSFDTKISRDIDPKSDLYHQQMIELYEEISGRKLNQSEGEQATVPDNTNFANPYALNDIRFINKHSRAILNSLMLADLDPDSWVLDMGCGWGLSTENIGFTGANVHALDINPDFVSLVDRRCKARSMSVKAECGEFDTFEADIQYDMIFFYECLHHSTSIIRTLGHISKFAKEDGCIIFCGEPVTKDWWGSWGMRLDPLSVYCIRKHGWFETGWSEDYVKSAFSEIGWKLWLIAGIGLDHGYIGLAVPNHTPDSILMERLSKVIPPHWATVL